MIKLSPSAIKAFQDCPRCFWLDKNHKIKNPRGIFPSLPGGMDRIIKPWYDQHRAAGAKPPEIAKLPGSLFLNQAKLNEWRNAFKGIATTIARPTFTIELHGGLDDLLMPASSMHDPLDYKTRGAAPKHDGSSEIYYGTQLSTYAYLLERNGLKTTGKGHLVYYWPKEKLGGAGDRFAFDSEIVTLDVKPELVETWVEKAMACLMSDRMPSSHPNCEYCASSVARMNFMNSMGGVAA